MNRKLVLLAALVILVGTLRFAFKVQRVEASGTIYIRADGSIDGPANITTADYVTYYFNESNYDSIVVERDNIIIDGNGYTLQGTGSGTGLNLTSRSNVTIKNTEIKAFDYGIELDASSNNSITGNNIANNGYGIVFEFSSNNIISGNSITANNNFGIEIYSSSNYTAISGNNITANNGDGIYLTLCSNSAVSDNNIANNAYGINLFGCSNSTISGNNITANNCDGIYLAGCSNSAVSDNNIANNGWIGIGLCWSSNNTIYHNNFVDNSIQVQSDTSTNVWVDGYPSGGNYWSDYTDVDLFSGPYQNETGCDGIGDIPYVIDGNNRDNYPLMEPYPDTTPPIITILSPENKTYATTSIPLTFTVDECTRWIAYSLDGKSNITITGNTTLSGLSEGTHTITVYANDTAGNMGTSSTVYFTVDTTPPDITDVSQIPEDNVLPTDEVKINATVTDYLSEVTQVILNFTNGNGTWITTDMTPLETNVWNATIPPFEYCTYVNYTIMAEDSVGNTVTTEELGYELQYHVIPESPSFLVLPLFMIAALLAAIVYRKKYPTGK